MNYQRFPVPERLRGVVEHVWLLESPPLAEVGEIQELAGVGRLGYLRDTEGVLIGLREA